ncbi:MAG: DinB family protein, partial [Campylobacter sp.]|nr:DinB family protein [Campylobacter sp.]
ATSIAKLFAACDEKIIQIIEKTPELEKIDELSFPGITFKKSRANLILALLNHSTHHRGIIGAQLELLGVSNDFNGMLGYEL